MQILEKSYKYLIIMLIIVISPAFADADVEQVFQQAVDARGAGNYEAARSALARAEALGVAPVRIALERARLCVAMDDPDAAVALLESVAESGFTGVALITGDPVLGTLAGNERFDDLVADMNVRAYPCEHDEAFRAFDFWAGEWDVHVASGAYAGSNVIEAEQRGCVLVERWHSATGGTGMSINYLDKATDEWVQVWNDSGGNQINIRGGLSDEGMLLIGTIHYVASDTTLPFRGLWTPMPDGRVRQFFEQSGDDGKTWSAWFEGFYSRKSVD